MNRFELPGARGTLRWQGTAVMGIVNVTPDSFSDGGRHADVASAVEHALQLMNDGALLVDVGGESTRPGSDSISAAEETARTVPVIRALAELGVPCSIDTRKPEVAEAALAAGAWLVNDIGGLRDPRMLSLCAEAAVPAVIMHMQGEPRTMQDDPVYGDVVAEVRHMLHEQAEAAAAAGVPGVLLDPGIGFGKTVQHNLTLLLRLGQLADLELPLLVGVSRKGFLKSLGASGEPASRDAASVAVHLDAARRGAAMVRVHDVASHVQALAAQTALLEAEV